jgi:superoxide dismutase, Fe-Mn family
MTHTLPPLPYAYNALEPYIDEQTMRIHHDKHHQAYVDNLNKALEGHTDLQKLPVEKLLANLEKVPEGIRTAVRNHGGGTWNHAFFWSVLKKGVKPSDELLTALEGTFGSYEKFKDEFTKASMSRFGSGWAWLVLDHGKLAIVSTANQDSPLSEGKTPLLCIDVWEHAYYILYNNRRADYVEKFYNVIDWEKVGELYKAARK